MFSQTTVERPDKRHLFEEIANFVLELRGTPGSTHLLPNQVAQAPSKKRKLDTSTDSTSWDHLQNYADISFSIPARKKLRLEIGKSPTQGLRGSNAGGEIEVMASWSQVGDIFCLPVPEKAQAQYNFCLFVKGPNEGSEQILWTVPDAVPKAGALEPPASPSSDETYRSNMLSKIDRALAKQKRRVIVPDHEEFVSQLVQAHRKSEKAYHVKAFRGAKDGFLFFLANGIFWGFKKPLEFFAFDAIESVSYTSVLQRTFNLNVTARPAPNDPPQEFEFSMLDQEDFAGIDAYIKRHRLQDASMAEQRRAKKLNVNGGRAAGDATDDNGEDGGGELQKAAREAEELEDEEDDEEDDDNFDPGSEGESEGEGSSSEEEQEAAA